MDGDGPALPGQVVEQVGQGQLFKAGLVFQGIQRLFQPFSPFCPDSHHAGPATGGGVRFGNYLFRDALQLDLLHEHGAVIGPIAPGIVPGAGILNLVNQGVDDNDYFTVPFQQVLQDIRPEQEIAVSDHHIVVEFIPGAGQ